MWPIQLAFRLLISYRIFLCSLTLSNSSSFLKRFTYSQGAEDYPTWNIDYVMYFRVYVCELCSSLDTAYKEVFTQVHLVTIWDPPMQYLIWGPPWLCTWKDTDVNCLGSGDSRPLSVSFLPPSRSYSRLHFAKNGHAKCIWTRHCFPEGPS